MKNYISIFLAAVLLASCSTKIQQPDPGVALGEIYLTASAGSKTVAVDLDGLWRVSVLEDWLSLDVNGRDGKGAFTFSYSSNLPGSVTREISLKSAHILLKRLQIPLRVLFSCAI